MSKIVQWKGNPFRGKNSRLNLSPNPVDTLPGRTAEQKSHFFPKLLVFAGLTAAILCSANSSFSSTFYTYNITYKDGTKKEVISTTPPKEYLRVFGDKAKETGMSKEEQEIVVNVDMDLTENEAKDIEVASEIGKLGGRNEVAPEKKPETIGSSIKKLRELGQAVTTLVKVAGPVVKILAEKTEAPTPQIKSPVKPKAFVKVIVPKKKTKPVQIVKAESIKPKLIPQPRAETFMATVTLEEYQRVEKYNHLITKYAKKRGLDPNLVKAIVLQESRGDHKDKSGKGATGLMQLMLATARLLDHSVTEEDLRNPEKNLSLGTKHLRNLVDYYKGDVVKAVAAYNAGDKPVTRYDGVPPYHETQVFVRRVLSFYQSLDAGIVPV